MNSIHEQQQNRPNDSIINGKWWLATVAAEFKLEFDKQSIFHVTYMIVLSISAGHWVLIPNFRINFSHWSSFQFHIRYFVWIYRIEPPLTILKILYFFRHKLSYDRFDKFKLISFDIAYKPNSIHFNTHILAGNKQPNKE